MTTPRRAPEPADVDALLEKIQHSMTPAAREHHAEDFAKLRAALRAARGEPVWVDQRGDGDCWIACLASLTGIPLDQFPQPPAREQWGDEQSEMAYLGAVRGFLKARGWWLQRMWAVPRGYAVATGDSPRLEGFSHCVVVRDGRVAHDPHPSRGGLSASTPAEFEVLIPLADAAGGGEPPKLDALEHAPGCDGVVAPEQPAASEGDGLEALRGLVEIIDAAGLLNLSNGVQLGPTAWYVKACDRMERARATLTESAHARSGE